LIILPASKIRFQRLMPRVICGGARCMSKIAKRPAGKPEIVDAKPAAVQRSLFLLQPGRNIAWIETHRPEDTIVRCEGVSPDFITAKSRRDLF
jgi:hypothetical protein